MYPPNTCVSLFCLTHHEDMKTDPSSQRDTTLISNLYWALLSTTLSAAPELVC